MRQRETAFDINTYYKYKVVTKLKTVRDEEHRKENYKNLIDYVSSNITKKEIPTSIQTNPITFRPPEYENIKKNYSNTKEKPIKFHEKAKIVNLDVGSIKETKVSIDFPTFAAMFDNNEEIEEVDREKLLGIDLEQLGSLKDKAGRLIEYLGSFDDNHEKDNVVKNLEKKIEDIKIMEEDIENVISNISCIDKIIYGKEETKIFFDESKQKK
jgi:hypothetical protein